MTPEERNLITGLFTRLKSADAPQKDQEAADLIQQSTSAQPTAPYLLVQTVLVQEHALSNATTRIQQLEKQLADAKTQGGGQADQHHEGGVGGFLSGLFGGHSNSQAPNQPAAPQARPTQPVPQQGYAPQPQQGYAQPQQMPYPSTTNMPPSAGGGFLKSALGTAAGVAGGAALFSGIQSLLGHNSGPFGGFGGGGGSFFGGGQGGYGGPEIIENHEVVNNYIDDRGNQNQGGNSSFLGGESVGFNPGAREDNRYDTANTDSSQYDTTPPTDDNTADTPDNSQYDTTPPTDDSTDDGSQYDTTPPTDDNTDSGTMDNSYDSGSSDSGGGSDDSSNV